MIKETDLCLRMFAVDFDDWKNLLKAKWSSTLLRITKCGETEMFWAGGVNTISPI